ncbi:MAG: geranylgeranylglycerol-phosphate geranylgeranyltransferase [Bacteroidales bacterium]|nr:geranylgeranylglycerol-phosphate geranylgeranyltransferase [Bacteroidales bacterium]
MDKIKSFFKLVRWPNLLMIAIMMLLVYYCLMSPLSASGIMGIIPSPPAFLLLLVSMIFIVAGGYVINDYYDIEIDRLNKPDKLIVGNIFSDKEAKFYYRFLTFIGLLSGLASSVMVLKTHFLTLFAILLLLCGVLHSYSSTYKKKFLAGNVIVSLSVAFAVFLPWLFEILYLSYNELMMFVGMEIMMKVLPLVLVYTAFAFLSTLMREIVKDAEDLKGDAVTNCRTVPVVCGMKATKLIICAMASLLYAVLIYFHIMLNQMESNVAMCVLVMADCILLVSVVNLIKAKECSDFHNVSTYLKLFMLIGILTMVFVC